MTAKGGPLAGLRVIESSLLGPGAITTHLADLGAEVIKVESPAGDYIREMTWPIVEGVSLLHLHVHRGKQSRRARPAQARSGRRSTSSSCAAPTSSSRRCARARSRAAASASTSCARSNPRIVFCNISGYGDDRALQGPARPTASPSTPGRASSNPAYDEEGFCYIPEHASMGMHAGPLFGALGILAGRDPRARDRRGLASSRSASPTPPPTWTGTASRAGRPTSAPSPRSRATRPTATSAARPGTAGMREGVRYQIYESRRRPRAVHGLRAGVLEELLRGRRAHGALRALARLAVRRPRARQPRAAARAARDLQDEDHRRVDRLRQREERARSRR